MNCPTCGAKTKDGPDETKRILAAAPPLSDDPTLVKKRERAHAITRENRSRGRL